MRASDPVFIAQNLIKGVLFFMLLIFSANTFCAQQTSPSSQNGGSLSGKITDTLGGLIRGGTLKIVDAEGRKRQAQSNSEGIYLIVDLPAGKYSGQVQAAGFTNFDFADVEVTSGKRTTLDVSLNVTSVTEQVTVAAEQPISTDPENNAGAIVLNPKEIDALPDDPAELQAALQALAGPGAGPNGGEVFVDGFSGGKLPPRDSIKEVRINSNPFSSEYDRMGLGRIEIITKPGSEKWGGEFVTQFEDESFNSRNPYAANRPPFQVRAFEGNLTGPIIRNKASFFLDAEHKNIDNNSLINARILDPNLDVVSFQQAILTPAVGIEINPRVDWQINAKNTLTVRYGYSRDTQQNGGLGGFDLLSRVYNNISSDHAIRLTETAVLTPTTVNELRIQFTTAQSTQSGSSNLPTIQVNDAFTAGGANIGQNFNRDNRLEINNNTSFIFGKHILKTGGRFRRVSVSSIAPSNFAGTFTFTSIDQYRNTLLNLPGAFPAQFSIAGGDPQASVGVTDYGVYVQDDWRVNPKLTLSSGLRYENQTGVSDNANFAPRFAIAYAPGAGSNKTPKTVFRAGAGIFYERFGRYLILQAQRFNGISQQQYIVTDPVILDSIVFTANGASNVPTVQSLNSFAQPQTTRIVSPALNIPRYVQTALSVERQLPFKTTVSLSYVNTGIQRQLRSRNINAPVNGVRPQPNAGNIFQYESTGRYNQNQLIVNFKSSFSKRISLFGNYNFGSAKSDTDSPSNFPANSYDLPDEYGDAAQDIRHRIAIGGSYNAPLGLRLSPFINYRSGVPFNITTGVDSNGDTLFTERPSFAASLNEPGIIVTRFGAFDPTPEVGDTIIPRNYGRSTNFFGVDLNIAKEIGFGGDGKDEAPYKLEFSVRFRNLFNRTNKGVPIGNLRSTFFGDAVSTAGNYGGGGGSSIAGNRRVRFEVQFSF
jgi:Carboxypeptidase regulatory-like domain/TonB dependent receptor